MPNGDPAKRLSSNNKFMGFVLGFPQLAPEDFTLLERTDKNPIVFYAVYPVYQEEMDFKLKFGAEKLFEKLCANNVTELVSISRKNVIDQSGFKNFMAKLMKRGSNE